MADSAAKQSDVLGKLLLMQSVIVSLPEAAILPFVVEGLMDLEMVGRVVHLASGEPSESTSFRQVLLSHAGGYGELCFYPSNPAQFLVSFDHIRNFLFMVVLVLDERRQRRLVEEYQRTLEAKVSERTQELMQLNVQLQAAQAATITAFSALTEARHHETGNHLQRTRAYVLVLAQALREVPRFQDQLDNETIQLYANSAPLHDIGKVGIPDKILLKRGRLSPEEWAIMKQHCVIGRDTIIASAREMGEGHDAFLQCAAEIAYHHHERWNGDGYPGRLRGEAIPLSARLMAVADVYDALTSPRVYKQAIPHELALAEMRKEAGCHFDPDILNALEGVADRFRRIGLELADRAA